MPPPLPPPPPSFSLPFGFDFGQTAKNFASAFIYANRNILKIYGSFTAICSIKSIRFLTLAPSPPSSSVSLCCCLPEKPVQRRKREKNSCQAACVQFAPDSVTGCGFDYVSPSLPPLHLHSGLWTVHCGSPSSVATFNFLQVYLPAPPLLPSFPFLSFPCWLSSLASSVLF